MPLSKAFGAWAQRYQAEAATDGYAWLLAENGWDVAASGTAHESPEALEFGEERARSFIEAVGCVLALRSMDRPQESPQWARRFLSLQRYGAEGFDVGARYSVRLLSPVLAMPLHIDAKSDIDLEDLHDSGFWDGLEFRANRDEDGTADHMAELFEAVRADVGFSGDLDVSLTEQTEWSFCVFARQVADEGESD